MLDKQNFPIILAEPQLICVKYGFMRLGPY